MPSALIHFHGGQSATTTIRSDELERHQGQTVALRDYLEKALNAPARPHWVWIGDVYVFSQAVSGVVPLSDVSEEVKE